MSLPQGIAEILQFTAPALMAATQQRPHAGTLPPWMGEVVNWEYPVFFRNPTPSAPERLSEKIFAGCSGNKMGSKMAYLNKLLLISKPLKKIRG